MGRKFKGFLKDFGVCPICGTSKQSETVLIKRKDDPNEDPLNDIQVHTECIFKAMIYDSDNDLLYINCDFKNYKK